MSTSTPSGVESRLRRARVKLEERLRAGDDARVEEILEADPVLAADRGAVIELIYTEFVIRRELGQETDVDEWLARFPDWQDDLSELFEVDEALAQADTVDDASPVPTRPGPRLPRRIGSYEILGELGRGGMGVVYRGRQTRLNRLVALKVILSGAFAGPRERERFQREVETAASLDHPNIVRVYEVGEHDGHPFCAMEYVAGGTLGRRMDGSPWSYRGAASLVALLARAVEHAHGRGVVHRDLKPDNVLIGEMPTELGDTSNAGNAAGVAGLGVPKIADFGLAKRLGQGEAGPTRTGDVVGTPAYMAPEQADGRSQAIGPATDLWALGIILYELLTGHVPFRGDSEADTLQSIRRDEPASPRSIRPRLPRDLETICLKCLEKEPGRRYASAKALAEDLNRWLAGEPIQARPIGPLVRGWKWVRRDPSTATWAGVVALLVTGSFVAVSTYAARADLRRREAEMAGRLAREARDQAERALYAQRVSRAFLEWQACNQEEAERLLEESRTAGPGWEWSYVSGLCRGELMTLEGHVDHVSSVAYSPDGLRIATGVGAWNGSKAGEVRLWEEKSGRLLHTLKGGQGPVMDIAFHPGGRILASGSARFASDLSPSVVLWDVETGEAIGRLEGVMSGVHSVAFHPDGRRMATGHASGEVRMWDVATRQPLETLGRHSRNAVFGLEFSPDGRLLASGGWDGTVRLWNLEDGGVQELRASSDVRSVAFSPDGRHIAAAGYSRAVSVWRVGESDPVVVHQHHDQPLASVAFSPDGLWLASSDNSGLVQLYPAFTPLGRSDVLRGHSGGVRGVAFRPDGLRLLSGGIDGSARVWDPWSPQESRSLSDGSLAAGTSLVYRPDNARLATASRGSRDSRLRAVDIRIWDVESGSLDRVLEGHGGGVTGLAYGPDGRMLASSSLDGTTRIWDPEAEGAKAAVATLEGHEGPVNGVVFSGGGGRLHTVGEDGSVRAWDLGTQRQTRMRRLGVGPLRRVAAHPEGGTLAVALADGTVMVLDDQSYEIITKDRLHDGVVEAIAFSPDGRWLASAGEDRTIRVRRQGGGPVLSLGPGHTATVTGLAFSPDGSRLASSSHDWTVRLWRLDDGTDTFVIRPQGNRVVGVAFRPDGRELAAGVVDGGRFLLWEVEQGAAERRARAEVSARNWSRRSVANAVREQRWEGALFHVERLLDAEPEHADWWLARGESLAALGRLGEAEADLRRAAELGRERQAFPLRALVLAMMGEVEAYQEVCRVAVERSTAPSDAARLNELAWNCCLLADAGVPPDRIVGLAEEAVRLAPGDASILNTLGVALYRAGRWEEAAARLRESIGGRTEGGLIEDWLFLAMALGRLDRPDEARAAWERGTHMLDEAPTEGPGSLRWSRRVSCELFRAEAAARFAIGGP